MWCLVSSARHKSFLQETLVLNSRLKKNEFNVSFILPVMWLSFSQWDASMFDNKTTASDNGQWSEYLDDNDCNCNADQNVDVMADPWLQFHLTPLNSSTICKLLTFCHRQADFTTLQLTAYRDWQVKTVIRIVIRLQFNFDSKTMKNEQVHFHKVRRRHNQ